MDSSLVAQCFNLLKNQLVLIDKLLLVLFDHCILICLLLLKALNTSGERLHQPFEALLHLSFLSRISRFGLDDALKHFLDALAEFLLSFVDTLLSLFLHDSKLAFPTLGTIAHIGRLLDNIEVLFLVSVFDGFVFVCLDLLVFVIIVLDDALHMALEIGKAILAIAILSRVLDVIPLDQMDVVTHDLELGLASIVLHIVRLLVECVAHDGDQHAQERDLDQESACEEEDVDQELLMCGLTVAVNHELSETQLVDSHKGVEDPELAKVGHDLIFCGRVVQIEDVERRAEHHVPNDQDDDEVFDAIERGLDQQHKEGCLIEKSQPVEDLDPQEDDCNRSECPLEVQVCPIAIDVPKEDYRVYDQVDEIIDVPVVCKVIKIVLTVLPLHVLTAELVADENQIKSNEWEVEDLVCKRPIKITF